jgi:peptidoglycan/xylan/chitin deacetylase (PgdA/CDA1 family)
MLVHDAYLRGRAQVRLARQNPSELRELRLGTWFDSPLLVQAARRALSHAGVARIAAVLGLGHDTLFWAGARDEATPSEWHHLTRSRYVALYYHRLAGLHKPGQERLDVSPERFAAQMRLLRRFGFAPLSPVELVRFHEDLAAVLPRRAIVVTADDGFEDCVEPLLRDSDVEPYLFVVTDAVGRQAWWVDDEPLADWDALERLEQSGVWIGSHTRTHPVLAEVEPPRLVDELQGAADELRGRLASPTALLAYPHGRHGSAVRAAAASAGYAAAFTTSPGSNTAATDPLALNRVGIKEWDSPSSFLWKAWSGSLLPPRWERVRLSLARRRLRRPRSTSVPRDA